MYFEIRKCDASSFVILSHDHFGYSESFIFHLNFSIVFFSTSVKKCHWDFEEDSIESTDHFG